MVSCGGGYAVTFCRRFTIPGVWLFVSGSAGNGSCVCVCVIQEYNRITRTQTSHSEALLPAALSARVPNIRAFTTSPAPSRFSIIQVQILGPASDPHHFVRRGAVTFFPQPADFSSFHPFSFPRCAPASCSLSLFRSIPRPTTCAWLSLYQKGIVVDIDNQHGDRRKCYYVGGRLLHPALAAFHLLSPHLFPPPQRTESIRFIMTDLDKAVGK